MMDRWLVNKLMDPLPLWLQVGVVVALLGAIAWDYTYVAEETAFMFHNHTDRPIHDVNLSGNWLGGAAASSGSGAGVKGGSICCARFNSGEADLSWTAGVTQSQYDAGKRKKRKTIKVIVPDRNNDELYLHVHVFGDEHVRFFWSHSTKSNY